MVASLSNCKGDAIFLKKEILRVKCSHPNPRIMRIARRRFTARVTDLLLYTFAQSTIS